ncbi:hypothetical protein F4604DRAFT_1688437 [Suillus subluteus]|nr:hypothetical protein F4604DRAFT_1688437 [Suillus subluteus]
MSSDWTARFQSILDHHQKAILTADSKSSQKCVVKKIHKAILAACGQQEEDATLPSSFKKAIKQYYAKICEDNEEAQKREATSRPKEVSFYKKTVSEWDVAQKLFKQEIDVYDKAEQQRKGLQHSIKYRTGHAREWFSNMTTSQQHEVKSAMKKWNKEGAPEESQAALIFALRYHKNYLKKTLEDFSEQIRHTMGCHVVMLVSHKKKASQTLSVTLHETEPQNTRKRFSVSSGGIKEWTAAGFESFAEWSKTEFYPSEDEDHAGLDNEDGGNGCVIPEIILDDDGYAILPSHDGIGLKGQHELIRGIFHASYKVCTGGSRPVPWGVITASSSNYLEPGSVPTGFVVKDPSHMKTEQAKVSDVHANVQNEAQKRKSEKRRVSALDSDEEDQDRPASLSGSPVTERRTQMAEHSNQTTPDDVAINDQYMFLESLSKTENYLELVDAVRDLAILANQKPISEQCSGLPTWADWSWGGSYLPENVHVSYAALKASLETLQTFPISGAPSAMPVVLGIELLYRESKQVIEYEEDEADPNTPFYLPSSALDLQFLVALDDAVREVLATVVGHIERITKESFSDEDQEQGDEDEVRNREMEMAVEQDAVVNQEMDRVVEQEQEQDEVEEVVQKGRKRVIPQASSSKSKKHRAMPEVRRSGRARQPSKKAQKI